MPRTRWSVRARLCDDRPGTIAASIFDEDNLENRRNLRHRSGKLLVQIEQRLLGTIDRNYNGNRKHERIFLILVRN